MISHKDKDVRHSRDVTVGSLWRSCTLRIRRHQWYIWCVCVTDRQEGGAVGYLATQCVCVIDQVINEMQIMSENTNRNRRHRRENTTCISGHEHKHHRSFSRFFFILLTSSSSSITDHYKYTKTPTDSSGLRLQWALCRLVLPQIRVTDFEKSSRRI